MKHMFCIMNVDYADEFYYPIILVVNEAEYLRIVEKIQASPKGMYRFDFGTNESLMISKGDILHFFNKAKTISEDQKKFIVDLGVLNVGYYVSDYFEELLDDFDEEDHPYYDPIDWEHDDGDCS